MSTILLPIHPEYAEKILQGTKKFEFRKKVTKNARKILIYATAPIKKVVGEVEVTNCIQGPISAIYRFTAPNGGITIEKFTEYFKDCTTAFAYQLGTVTRYEHPKELSEIGIKHAPQSFCYAKEI